MKSKACERNHLQKHPGFEFEFVDLRLNEGNPTQFNKELVGKTVFLVRSFSGARTGTVNCLWIFVARSVCVFVGKISCYKSSASYETTLLI